MPDRVSPAFIDEQAEVTPEMWSYLMDRVSPASPVEIAEMLRRFRLSVDVAGSRMPWATDWPLDRLACEAADLIEAQQATIQQLREALAVMDRRFRILLARQEHFPDSEDEKALDIVEEALARSDGQEPR
jgi:hypothetical protein